MYIFAQSSTCWEEGFLGYSLFVDSAWVVHMNGWFGISGSDGKCCGKEKLEFFQHVHPLTQIIRPDLSMFTVMVGNTIHEISSKPAPSFCRTRKVSSS